MFLITVNVKGEYVIDIKFVIFRWQNRSNDNSELLYCIKSPQICNLTTRSLSVSDKSCYSAHNIGPDSKHRHLLYTTTSTNHSTSKYYKVKRNLFDFINFEDRVSAQSKDFDKEKRGIYGSSR